MNKSEQEQVAIFRYGLIAPALHMTKKQRRKYFQALAGKEFDLPHYGRKKYQVETFRHWLSSYRMGGVDSLKPALRSDKGISRRISERVISIVKGIIKELPSLSAAGIYRILIKQDHIQPGDFAEGTLRECIKKNLLRDEGGKKKERKKFEKENVNELWTCDFMQGPYLKVGKRKRKTFLCAIIDDHSRIIVGWGWDFCENSMALANALKGAIAIYGVPCLLYCDNGKVFHANYLQLIAANLGMALVHSEPYDSPSRGKIERFFRTVRQKFLAGIDASKLTLTELNNLYREWLDKSYHKEPHKGINARPLDRYLENAARNKIKTLSSHELDNSFLHIITRCVKNDATVSVNNKLYEVPSKYIGKKVELSFPIDQPEKLTLMEEGKPHLLLKEVNLGENASKPYTAIHFRNIDKEEDGND